MSIRSFFLYLLGDLTPCLTIFGTLKSVLWLYFHLKKDSQFYSV